MPIGRVRLHSLADMSIVLQIGDPVTLRGRRYRVRGFQPMSVPGRRVDLEDVATGRNVRVRIGELEGTPEPLAADITPPRSGA